MPATLPLRVFVVEDERPARAALVRMLARMPGVEVVGEADDVPLAVHGIAASRPDAVFLDIELPSGSGFSVLEQLDFAPEVVFATAFQQHAASAFDVYATDYLLKPYAPDRLTVAVSRIRDRLTAAALVDRRAESEPMETTVRLERVYIRKGRRIVVVPLSDVLRIEADGMYVRLFTPREVHVASISISELARRLPAAGFLRVHRGHIVNMAAVSGFTVLPSGRLQVDLQNGASVPCSREYAKGIRHDTW